MGSSFQAPQRFVDILKHKIEVSPQYLELSNRLIPTLCVSPPRSGHHLLTNYLFKYFSGDVTFSDLAGHETAYRAKEIIAAGPLYYCEYYNHCRRIPCID